MKRIVFLSAALLMGLSFVHTSRADDGQPVLYEPAGFANFVGTWTLKDDRFEQIWDGETLQTLSIPDHITVCTSATTPSSLSCTVDAGGLTGQIFWVADADRRTFQHLSHFGERRRGVGSGQIDSGGDLESRIEFADEPDGTYRIYEYKWITQDQYWMVSRQYDADGEPTGNWYGGSFVRVED